MPKTVAAFLSQPTTPNLAFLHHALTRVPGAPHWQIILAHPLPRPTGRITAILVLDRAIVALLIRPGTGFRPADRLAIEDAALDLADGHESCRNLPVIPILVVPDALRPNPTRPFPLPGAAPPLEANRLLLPILLREIAAFPLPAHPPKPWSTASQTWSHGLIDAARLLYVSHDLPELRTALATTSTLGRATAAARAAAAQAAATLRPTIVFITGPPGAGKTLCGLDLAFTSGAAYLTANPTLVHVVREALARDAGFRGLALRAARQRVAAIVQALPRWRDAHLARPAPPGTRILVIDEAQRCWTRPHAIAKTRAAKIPLSDSEPGHLLDALARRPDGPVLIVLCGNGQEIHAGEGGLATWGEALAARPHWQILAAPEALIAPGPRQRLPNLPHLTLDPALHLHIPRRQRHPTTAAWTNHLLDANLPAARTLAAIPPIHLTRSLTSLREALRRLARGSQRAGLVASSHARRLRAEGLGGRLEHQDADAVARWFLDRPPDPRSAGALELAATEFAIQGLELDWIGLCWDLDLLPTPGGWAARAFRGDRWTKLGPTPTEERRNAYRVLLTRARRATLVWVPRGDSRDPTRPPAAYDAIAGRLLDYGATPLDNAPPPLDDPEAASRTLL